MRLREYREKPAVKFWGTDGYYLGMELEVEAPTSEARAIAIKPLIFGLHAKRDGSLDRATGVEIVTHPFARNLWLEQSPKKGVVSRFFKLVAKFRELHFRSHEGGKCGLHLHVCRKAFGTDLQLGTHYYWFSRLVNGRLFRKLSQREDAQLDRWTAQSKPQIIRRSSYLPIHQQGLRVAKGCNRYVALNVLDKTVEVRLFRGNLREERIRKAVEAVVAAVEFARTRSSKNWGEDLDQAFIAYAIRNRRVYPNLAAYLVEIGLATAPAEPEPAPPVTTRTVAKTLASGTVLTRRYKGRVIQVTVMSGGGFLFAGTVYRSLTAAAKAATGRSSINARWFFGVDAVLV